jgi:hypothetical protein
MNKLVVLVSIIFVAAFCSNICAQGVMPPGASDKNLEDRNIKNRSNELERIKRDAQKPKTKQNAEPNFALIKEDFEQIQLLFDNTIVKVYKSSTVIDYKQISKASAEIKERAARLKSNLFPVKSKKSKDGKEETVETAVIQSDVKTLIMNLDAAITAFVGSPIFQNTKVVDPKDSEKTMLDLENVIKISAALEKEADKLK